MIAYSYLRFSTPEQALGDSERRQVEKADAWATAKGIPLDKSYADRGKSGFKGVNRKKGALGRFLKEIKSLKVPYGSYLLVEDLDRLSREHPLDSLPLINEIISAGITIVVLKNNEEYSSESLRADRSGMKMVGLSFELGRASGESARKSDLGIDNWKEKRRLAAKDNKPMTVMTPAWIRTITSGEGRRKERRYELIPEHACVVREMFAWHKAGKGLRTIASILNDRKEPNWGRGKRTAKQWHKTYVQKILSNVAVLGHFQPHKYETVEDPDMPGERKQIRVPVGDVLKKYYPAVFEKPEEIELAEHVLKKVRARAKGPTGGRIETRISNLFPGLLFGNLPDPAQTEQETDEPSPAPSVVVPCRYKSQHGNGHGQYIITNIVAANKARKVEDHLTNERWPYPAIEYAILQTLQEINWTAVAGEARTPEQTSIATRAAALESKVAELQTECDNVGMIIRKTPLPTLVRDLAELEAQKEAIEREADELRNELGFLETSRQGLIAPLSIQEAAHDPTNRDVRFALRAELACRIKCILLNPKKKVTKKHRYRTTFVYAFEIMIEFVNGVTRSIRIRLNRDSAPTISTVAFQPPQGLPLPPAIPEDDFQAVSQP